MPVKERCNVDRLQYYSTKGKYFVPVLHPERPDDDSYRKTAEIRLDPLASLPHAQTMVEHMVNDSCSNLIGDDGSPVHQTRKCRDLTICVL